MEAKVHEPLAKTANLCVLFCSILFSMFSQFTDMSKSYKNLLPAASRCAVDDQRHLRCPLGHRASSNSLEQRQAGRGVRNCLVGGLKGRCLNIGCLCGGSQCVIYR